MTRWLIVNLGSVDCSVRRKRRLLRLLACLITLGLFCVLAVYSHGKYVSREWHQPSSESEFVARKLAEYRPREDVGVVYRPADCNGGDWLACITWAEEKHPTKRKKKA